MEKISEILKKLVEFINPVLVDWQNTGSIVSYALRLLLIIIIAVGLYFIILNSKKIFRFFETTYSELKLVDWLNRRDTIKFSLITISLIVLFTLFILLADRSFLNLRNLLILRGI